jgi:hypothetical protein
MIAYNIVKYQSEMKPVFNNIGIGQTKHRCANSWIVDILINEKGAIK